MLFNWFEFEWRELGEFKWRFRFWLWFWYSLAIFEPWPCWNSKPRTSRLKLLNWRLSCRHRGQECLRRLLSSNMLRRACLMNCSCCSSSSVLPLSSVRIFSSTSTRCSWILNVVSEDSIIITCGIIVRFGLFAVFTCLSSMFDDEPFVGSWWYWCKGRIMSDICLPNVVWCTWSASKRA